MFAAQTIAHRKKDEAEKPFWISFADLMTALMILFLVVMCVALLAVTRPISEIEKARAQREKDIELLLTMLSENVQKCGHATVLRERRVIDFGSQATFSSGSHQLSASQVHNLRECVPEILAIAGNELGRKWIKRIVVEGYADLRGSYLYNLNLSLQRSQRILCTLLLRGSPTDRVLTPEERKQIRELFLVGGYSFNEAKESFEVSRRAELRLEFWGLAEPHSLRDDAVGADDIVCELDKPVVPPARAPTPTPSVGRAPSPSAPPPFNPFQIR
jgi:Membrane MotB of proton-channel complex MotA/MotB